MGTGMHTEWTVFALSVAGFFVCAGLTGLALPPILRMLHQSGWVRPNYKGDPVPVAAGVALVAAFLAAGVLLLLAERLLQIRMHAESLLFLAAGMAFLGLLDDLSGSRETGGLKGHWQKWARDGQLTTGLIKAAGGLLLSFGAVLSGTGWPAEAPSWNVEKALSLPVDALIVALSANWVNLLDVRPGRALKGILLQIGITLFFVSPALSVPLLMLAGIAVACLPADLRAKAMMGDTGANFFGAVLGYLAVQSFGFGVRLVLLAALVALHAYTEARSLTKLIESNKWLAWLDELGRERAR